MVAICFVICWASQFVTDDGFVGEIQFKYDEGIFLSQVFWRELNFSAENSCHPVKAVLTVRFTASLLINLLCSD